MRCNLKRVDEKPQLAQFGKAAAARCENGRSCRASNVIGIWRRNGQCVSQQTLQTTTVGYWEGEVKVNDRSSQVNRKITVDLSKIGGPSCCSSGSFLNGEPPCEVSQTAAWTPWRTASDGQEWGRVEWMEHTGIQADWQSVLNLCGVWGSRCLLPANGRRWKPTGGGG